MPVVKIGSTSINTVHFAAFVVMKVPWGPADKLAIGAMPAAMLPPDDSLTFPFVVLAEGLEPDDAYSGLERLAAAQALEPLDELATAQQFKSALKEIQQVYEDEGDNGTDAPSASDS